MMFHVDEDNGTRIRGWFVPDNPSDVPTFVINVDDNYTIDLLANSTRPDMKELGRHSTGQCGFDIGPELIENLSQERQIELRDQNSNILIYRRFRSGTHLTEKLFFLEINPYRHIAMVADAREHFALCYSNMQDFPAETTYGVLNNQFSNSIFVHGAPNFLRNIYTLRTNKFKMLAFLRDPLEDLAEKLLLAQHLRRNPGAVVHSNQFAEVSVLVDFASNMRDFEERTLNATFKGAPDNIRGSLSNPLTRVIGCEPGAQPDKRAVTTALDNLAAMTLVGVQTEPVYFQDGLADLLKRNVTRRLPTETTPKVKMVAQQLRKSAAVIDLLEYDIMLYNFVENAVKSAIIAEGQTPALEV